MNWCVFCIRSIVIILLAAVAFRHTQADEPTATKSKNFDLEPRELFLRIASERERIIQYKCRVRIDLEKSPDKHVDMERIPRETICEYSRLEDHHVFARRTGTAGKDEWSLTGWTGETVFMFKHGTKSLLFLKAIPGNKELIGKSAFEPLAVGLAGCVEFRMNHSFEQRLAGLMSYTLNPNPGDTVRKSADGIYRFASPEELEVKIDSNRGYWPIYWRWTPDGPNGPPKGKKGSGNEWNVELTKVDDYYVPSKATVVCDEGLKAVLEFQWESINKPMLTGDASGEYWAKFLKVPTEDMRDMKRDIKNSKTTIQKREIDPVKK